LPHLKQELWLNRNLQLLLFCVTALDNLRTAPHPVLGMAAGIGVDVVGRITAQHIVSPSKMGSQAAPHFVNFLLCRLGSP
jgi:hypothetical protein